MEDVSMHMDKIFQTGILNGVPSESSVSNPLELSKQLLTNLIEMMKSNDYKDASDLKKHPLFTDFHKSTSNLRNVKLSELSNEEKLSFWLNIYHTLALHSNILLVNHADPPKTLRDRLDVSIRSKYVISNTEYSLTDIEFSILRKTDTLPPAFSSVKLSKSLDNPDAPDKFDPRINFVLNPAIAFGPQIHIYSSTSVFDQLNKSTYVFFKRYAKYEPENKKIFLPINLSWYMKNFGSTNKELLETLSAYIFPEKSVDVANLEISFYEGEYGPIQRKNFDNFSAETKVIVNETKVVTPNEKSEEKHELTRISSEIEEDTDDESDDDESDEEPTPPTNNKAPTGFDVLKKLAKNE